MSYTPKPKNLTHYFHTTTSHDTHTWQTSDVRPVGSSAGLSIAQRRLKEARRGTVGSYQQSVLANSAVSERRNIANHVRQERQKLDQRLQPQDEKGRVPSRPSVPQPRALPSAPLYRRPNF